MKAGPANDADPKNLEPGPGGSFVGPLLATMTSAITVLGAILLSLQGQAQNIQPVARVSEGTFASIDVIPTAPIATVPPDNLFPTQPLSGTVQPVPDQTPSLSPEISITPTALDTTLASGTPVETTVSLPASTPRPCGGVPLSWKLYVVQRGDTLFSLARRHRTSVDLVIFHNCLPGTKIWAGQRLYLPPLPTPVPSATATATVAPSPTPTPPPPPSPIPTLPPTPLPSATATATSRPTPGPIVTATVTVAVTASPTLSPTATATGTPTATSVLTPTATASPTVSATPSATPTPSASATATPSPTSTPSPSPTPTGTPATSPSP